MSRISRMCPPLTWVPWNHESARYQSAKCNPHNRATWHILRLLARGQYNLFTVCLCGDDICCFVLNRWIVRDFKCLSSDFISDSKCLGHDKIKIVSKVLITRPSIVVEIHTVPFHVGKFCWNFSSFHLGSFSQFETADGASAISREPLNCTGLAKVVLAWEKCHSAVNLKSFGTNRTFLTIFLNRLETQCDRRLVCGNGNLVWTLALGLSLSSFCGIILLGLLVGFSSVIAENRELHCDCLLVRLKRIFRIFVTASRIDLLEFVFCGRAFLVWILWPGKWHHSEFRVKIARAWTNGPELSDAPAYFAVTQCTV